MKALSRTAGGKDRKSDWSTPRWFFEAVQEKYQVKFDLDVMASRKNSMCPRFISEKKDAFKTLWEGRNIWCNPPDIIQLEAIQRCIEEAIAGRFSLAAMLVRSGLETRAWDIASQYAGVTEVIRPRLNYLNDGVVTQGIAKHSTLFTFTPNSASEPLDDHSYRMISLSDYRKPK